MNRFPELLDILQELLGALLWQKVLVAFAVLLFFLLLRGIFVRYVLRSILKLMHNAGTELGAEIIASLEKPFKAFFVILGIYFACVALSLSPNLNLLILKLLRASVIVLIAWSFYNLLSHSFLLESIGQKIDINIDKILIPFLIKFFKFLTVALALIIIAQEWGYDVSGFIAGLGLGGLAVALAAKDALANIFGGIVIITDKPFSIGDWIYTPSVEGTVEDMSFRSTKIRTFANALVTVPNSVLANEPVTNWSRMGKRRVTFNFGVRYGTPKESLEKCMQEIRVMLENHPAVHPDVIMVRFEGFSESSLGILVYYFTKTIIWAEHLATKEEINFKIMEILQQEGVSFALPSRNVYLKESQGTAGDG
jgi:MscS family membrane protein